MKNLAARSTLHSEIAKGETFYLLMLAGFNILFLRDH